MSRDDLCLGEDEEDLEEERDEDERRLREFLDRRLDLERSEEWDDDRRFRLRLLCFEDSLFRLFLEVDRSEEDCDERLVFLRLCRYLPDDLSPPDDNEPDERDDDLLRLLRGIIHLVNIFKIHVN